MDYPWTTLDGPPKICGKHTDLTMLEPEQKMRSTDKHNYPCRAVSLKTECFKLCNFRRLRVVPLSLSPSCVTRKKTARKKWPREILEARRAAARDPAGGKNAKGGTTA